MARDEAILEAVAAGLAPPTLRFYGWSGRWLSIGMAERIADVDLTAARQVGVGIVRRPSGGTAVLHVDQVAWSLALPAGHPLAPDDIVETYRRHGEITVDALRLLGARARAASVEDARAPLPDPVLAVACFGGLAPHEIVVGTPLRKLVGWGQVRRRGVVMHHAVLSLRFEPKALAQLLDADRCRLVLALRRRVADLADAAGRTVAPRELQQALVTSFVAAGYRLRPGALGEAEARRAAELVQAKYAADEWTSRR